MKIEKIILSVVIILNALTLQPANADVFPSNTLIQLQSRVFDMRVDASKIRRADYFIPITRVDWIYDLKNADPHLDPTVIQIHSYGGELENLSWGPKNIDEYFTSEVPVPDHLAQEGYDHVWRGKFASEHGGDLAFIPKENPFSFIVICPYIAYEGWPKLCVMTLTYPPDPHLLIRVRIYLPTRPMNDFRAIAHKARTLVYCYLDVTEAVKNGTWVKREPIDPSDEDYEIKECRETIS